MATPAPAPPAVAAAATTATTTTHSSSSSSHKKGSPNDFLKGVIGKRVSVRLNSGIDYQGILSCLDGYMNIAMEQTAEYVDGQFKNSYGDAFIRGNNGMYTTQTPAPPLRQSMTDRTFLQNTSVMYITALDK